MKEETIPFGDKLINVQLPDRTYVIKPGGIETPIKVEGEIDELVRRAIRNPVDRPPIKEIVKPDSKVLIAFDDPTVICYAPLWHVGINLLIDELTSAGVKEKNIILMCANGLHRQFTKEELAKILGEDIVKRFHKNLMCHDAENPEGIIYLGKTDSGYDVELNKLVVEVDLTVYLNTASFLGFNGGWKSICVGLGTWRSIKHHHKPEIMSMSLEENRLHKILNEMGELVERKIGGEKIFKLETVLANPLTVANIWGGSVRGTREMAEEVLKRHHKPRRTLIPEKVDIIVYGVPDWSPYATFSFTNPILTLSSTGLGYLGGYIEAIGKEGCSVIMATPCPERWDEVHHPSYKEVWERVIPRTKDPYKIMEEFEEEFVNRKDYIEKYRFHYGFHPVHGLLALQPLKRLKHAGRVYVAGIENPKVAEHMGFIPMPSVEDALKDAMKVHGSDASIALIKYPLAFNRQ